MWQLKRPFVKKETAVKIVNDVFDVQAQDAKEMVSFVDRNFQIRSMDGNLYTLKILNPDESADEDRIAAQVRLADHLSDHGFVCPKHLQGGHGHIFWKQTFPINSKDGEQEECIVRFLTYIPGEPLGRSLHLISQRTYQHLGVLLAHMHETLKDYPVKGLELDVKKEWTSENVDQLRIYVENVKDDNYRSLGLGVVDRVKRRLAENCENMEKAIVHNDMNDYNIILLPHVTDFKMELKPDNSKKMFGIIDFGEACYTYIIFEIGRLIAEMMSTSEFPEVEVLQLGAHVVFGYSQTRTISKVDMSMMYDSLCINLLQHAVLGEYAFTLQNDNPYSQSGSAEAKHNLERVISLSSDTLYTLWKDVLKEVGFPQPLSPIS